MSSSLTVTQLAARWQCSDQHVRNLIRRGQLRAFRVGKLYRIPLDVVVEYETPPVPPPAPEPAPEPTPTATEAKERTIRLPSGRCLTFRETK